MRKSSVKFWQSDLLKDPVTADGQEHVFLQLLVLGEGLHRVQVSLILIFNFTIEFLFYIMVTFDNLLKDLGVNFSS